MSTHQPGGGSPPDPNQGYAQPQDPWEGGYEPGLASVPTDPIPQQYEPYPHGQGYPQGDVWSQATAAHGPQYGYQQQPPPAPNRTGMIVLIVLVILVLGGGGGFAAWYVTSQRSATTDPTTSPTQTQTQTEFSPYAVKVNDCIRNNSPSPRPTGVDENPEIAIVECSADDSYKVVAIFQGEDLAESQAGKLDDFTAAQSCRGTGYGFWYAYDDNADDTKDLLFCLTQN
jgi:hypothetical protein